MRQFYLVTAEKQNGRYTNGEIPEFKRKENPVKDTKGALMSMGINGSLLVILTSIIPVLEVFHVIPAGFVPNIVEVAGPVVGGLLALFGRLKASSKILGLF